MNERSPVDEDDPIAPEEWEEMRRRQIERDKLWPELFTSREIFAVVGGCELYIRKQWTGPPPTPDELAMIEQSFRSGIWPPELHARYKTVAVPLADAAELAAWIKDYRILVSSLDRGHTHPIALQYARVTLAHGAEWLHHFGGPRFNYDPLPEDIDAAVAALNRLLGEVEKLAVPPPTPPVVTIGPAQIVMDGQAYPLTPDAAEYLKALIGCGDWMSDPEYKRLRPEVGDNFKARRLNLPDEIKDYIQIHKSRGRRWKTPEK